MKKVKKPNKADLENYRKNHSVKETAKYFEMGVSTMEELLRAYDIYGIHHLKRLNAPDTLTEEQQETLIGNLLGDGWITALKSETSNSDFEIEQKQFNSSYVKYLYEVYGDFSKKYSEGRSLKPVRVNGKVDNSISKGYAYWCKLRTISHPIFTELRHKWYENPFAKSAKIIPEKLKLTWRTIAFWACDDGSSDAKRRDFKFYTDCFSIRDADFLLSLFKSNFGIVGKIHLRDGKPVLYFYGDAAEIIKKSIKQFIPWSCFAHKLIPNKPRALTKNKLCDE